MHPFLPRSLLPVAFALASLTLPIHAADTPLPSSSEKPLAPPGPSAPPPALPGLDSKKLRPLFDGRTLAGWNGDPSVWTIVDGALHGIGKSGQIFSNGDYGDFRLIVTSRVVTPDGNPNANHLGIVFWGDRPESGKWNLAGALQVQPPHGSMWDYRTNKNVAPGTLTRVVPKPAHSYHDWHVCEILAHLATGELRVAVDGVEITHYKHGDPSMLKRGPIGLQLHAAKAEMEYKDIKIETDPPEDRLITVK